MRISSGWTTRLLDLVVDGLEPVATRRVPAQRWVAVEEGEDFVLYRVRRGRAEAAGRLAAGAPVPAGLPRRVELRLAPARILTRTLSLPAAGRAYLDAIVANRLDRLTPWLPDRVAYGYAARPGDVGGSVAVDFAAAARNGVEASVSRLAAFGLAPSAVGSAADPLEAPPPIDLRPGRSDDRRRLRRRTGLALVLVLGTFSAAAAGSLVWRLSAEADSDALTARLAERQLALRSAAGARAGGRDRDLIAAKTEETAVGPLLDRLADALPDDTWIRELAIDAERVRLVGQSADAPALIAPLAALPGLTDVAFSAPVVRGADGRDEFDIAAARRRAGPGGAP